MYKYVECDTVKLVLCIMRVRKEKSVKIGKHLLSSDDFMKTPDVLLKVLSFNGRHNGRKWKATVRFCLLENRYSTSL